MVTRASDIPVDDSLTVLDAETIYQSGDWWKAAVRYYFDENVDSDEVAVYLWHNDPDDQGWTRKNKYVVRTVDGWQTDTKIIEQFLTQEFDGAVGDDYPVSDYYEVAAGQTVFQSDGWWKAILNISRKGSYETDEVIIYLWQEVDGDWRRRQKYAIKDNDDWQQERRLIEELLDADGTAPSTREPETSTEPPTDPPAGGEGGVGKELTELNEELEDHLSQELAESED